MMLLGWLNIFGLVALASRLTAGRDMPQRERPLWWFVFIWLTLILTGHVLSLFTLMNNPYLYCGLSLMLLAGLIRAYDSLAPHGSAPSPLVPHFAPDYAAVDQRWAKYLIYGLGIVLLLAAACSLLLVLHNQAGNADSISYRLPRAYWYTSHGSLLHPFDSYDRRVTYYPLNGTLLYVPLVVFGFPGTFHNLPTFLTWIILALTVYCAGRAMGAPKPWALLSMALVVLTPNILVQAAATNDEILAGTALLLGVYLLFRWLVTDQKIYLLLSATIAGISIGTKLHVVFFLPVLALGGVMALYTSARRREAARAFWRRIGWRTGFMCVGIGLALIVPFLIYNKISAGRFYFTDDFASQFFNVDSKIHVALQNALIYTAQMLIAPVADLYGAPDHVDREAFHALINNFFRPLIEPWLSTDRADYHLHYSFTGITLGVSPYYLEYSLWAGFSFFLAPLLLWQLWRNRKTLPLYGWWMLLTLSPLIWFVTWCASTLYMEGTPTYLAYYLIIAAPVTIFAMLKISRVWLSRLRWVLLAWVLLTHTVIDTSTYLYNEFRNIPRLMKSMRLPYDWELMDQNIIDEIKVARKIRIVFTHWGLSYFGFMRHNPHAFYYGPHEQVADLSESLVLFTAPSAEHWGNIPLEIPHKSRPGLTYIGRMRGWGPEGVFAAGNGVEARWPDRNRYVLFSVLKAKGKTGYEINFSSGVSGLNADEGLQFRYEIRHNDRLLEARDWETQPGWRVAVPEDPAQANYKVSIAVRLPGQVAPDAATSFNLSGIKEWTDAMPGMHAWEEIGD
ncbi:MAG: hypothetical protein WBK91_01730 [Alphaproteobacteria bacterium]